MRELGRTRTGDVAKVREELPEDEAIKERVDEDAHQVKA